MGIWDRIKLNLRGHDRLACSHDFEVDVQGQATLMAALMDISRSGCRIMVDGRVEPGDHVVLHFSKSSSHGASVKWSTGSVAGCAFDKPLNPTSVRAIMSRCRGLGGSSYGYGDVSSS